MSSLVIQTHTGLGDHIIANGMVHAYAEDHDKVYVPHIAMFGKSIRALYAGYDNIETVELPDIDVVQKGMHLITDLLQKTGSEYMGICDPHLHYTKRNVFDKEGKLVQMFTAINFDRQFYELAGLHFSVRYTNCKIPDSTEKSINLYKQLSKEKDYILVHNGSSQSDSYPLHIKQISNNSSLPIIEIKPGITNNVFDFVDLIKNAKEIHAVGSFFQCLVDSMIPQTSAELYYHNIMMKHESQINCAWNDKRWKLVDYDRKY